MRCRQGSRASVRGGKHNLVGIFLPEVAHRKDTDNVRLAFLVRDHISSGVHFYSCRNELVVRGKADKNEHAIGSHVPACVYPCAK